MNNRNFVVAKKLKTVKRMHAFMMIGWPLLLVVAMFVDSYLFHNMDAYNYFGVVLISRNLS